MTISRAQRVPRNTARRLIDLFSGRLDRALTRVVLVDVYILSDGRVILVDWESPTATMYSDRASLDAVLTEASCEGRHILFGVFPDAAEFPARAESIIRDCLLRYCLQDSPWPTDQRSVRTLDEHLLADLRHDNWWIPFWIPRLVACSGGVIIKAMNGAWTMRPSQIDQAVLEPWITLSDGTEVQTFTHLYDLWEEGVMSRPGVGVGPIELSTSNVLGRLPP